MDLLITFILTMDRVLRFSLTAVGGVRVTRRVVRVARVGVAGWVRVSGWDRVLTMVGPQVVSVTIAVGTIAVTIEVGVVVVRVGVAANAALLKIHTVKDQIKKKGKINAI